MFFASTQLGKKEQTSKRPLRVTIDQHTGNTSAKASGIGTYARPHTCNQKAWYCTKASCVSDNHSTAAESQDAWSRREACALRPAVKCWIAFLNCTSPIETSTVCQSKAPLKPYGEAGFSWQWHPSRPSVCFTVQGGAKKDQLSSQHQPVYGGHVKQMCTHNADTIWDSTTLWQGYPREVEAVTVSKFDCWASGWHNVHFKKLHLRELKGARKTKYNCAQFEKTSLW